LSINLSPVIRPIPRLIAVGHSEMRQDLLIDLLKVVVCAKKNPGSSDRSSRKKKHPRKRFSPHHDNSVRSYEKIVSFVIMKHLGRHFSTVY